MLILFISLIVIIVLGFSFWKLSTSKLQKVPKTFLQNYYSMSINKEYVDMKNIKDAKDPMEAVKDLMNEYNKQFDSLVTEECLSSLWASRTFLQYLSFLEKSKCTISVDNVQLEKTGNPENTLQYRYVLDLTIKKDKKEIKGSGSGNISMEKTKNGQWKITYFKRDDEKVLYDLVMSI